jgi:dihydroorotase-like cyclic amidohydrolase
LRQDINCFDVDFSIPLVTVSVCIENIIWKWSDYKAYRDKIFFNPPIRESWQVKALFKWINRWVVSWIYIKKMDEKIESFLSEQITGEHILPLTFSRVLNYNYIDIWIFWEKKEIDITY